ATPMPSPPTATPSSRATAPAASPRASPPLPPFPQKLGPPSKAGRFFPRRPPYAPPRTLSLASASASARISIPPSLRARESATKQSPSGIAPVLGGDCRGALRAPRSDGVGRAALLPLAHLAQRLAEIAAIARRAHPSLGARDPLELRRAHQQELMRGAGLPAHAYPEGGPDLAADARDPPIAEPDAVAIRDRDGLVAPSRHRAPRDPAALAAPAI